MLRGFPVAVGEQGHMGIVGRIRSMNPQLKLFLVGTALASAASGIFETTFNNFLATRFDISAFTRGWLEFPRELPGFLTAVLAGALFFLPETMVGVAAALAIAAGMAGLALWGSSWSAMLACMILWSTGAHLMMSVRPSVAIHLADKTRKGTRLGQVQGVEIAATVVGCALVWGMFKLMKDGYSWTFTAGAVLAAAAALLYALMRLPGAHLKRPRFVWRREYWLYYVLALLFGGRKQIFITFGPWVLVRVFNQPPEVFAQLWIAAAMIGVVTQPLLGRLIDRLGERTILLADSFLLILVCAGYGCAHWLDNRSAALGILYVCYVADNLLFGVNMARTTYLSKILVKPEDMGPTLSLGISINHAVSMLVPTIGGFMWITWGHPSVFLAAAGIAVLMAIFASRVRIPSGAGTGEGNKPG